MENYSGCLVASRAAYTNSSATPTIISSTTICIMMVLRRVAPFAAAWSGLLGDLPNPPVPVRRAINPLC